MATVNDAVVQGKFMFLSGAVRRSGSVWQAIGPSPARHWMTKPWLSGIHQPERAKTMETDRAVTGNRVSDQTEVSRGNSSQTLTVMGETRRSPEHNE